MKTLKEESDEGWEAFEKTNRSGEVGGKKVVLKNPQVIQITDFCATYMCNLFHADDIARILWVLREPFECTYLGNDGRDRFCQFKVRGKYFDVYASGYGLGETIEFEKGFDEDLKFKICRMMSWEQSYKDMERHAPEAEEPEVGGVKIVSPATFGASKEMGGRRKTNDLMHAKWHALYKEYREKVWEKVRSMDELLLATQGFHEKYNKIYKEGQQNANI